MRSRSCRKAKLAMATAWTHVVCASLGLAAPAKAFADDIPGAARAPGAKAPSPSAGGDVIDLKTGGVLRGTLIDAIPSDHARIQLVTGEIATVPWNDIERIERAPASAAAPPTATDERAWVHITGSEVAQLQRDTAGDRRHWENVCSAPCDQEVSLQYAYRVTGAGMRNSGPFTLQAQRGERETLAVDEGSKGGFVLGIVGVSVGSLAATIGLLVVLASAAVNSVDHSASASSDAENVGLAITGFGVAAVVGGVVLIVTNARSGVTQAPYATPASRLPSFGPSVASGPSLSAWADAKRAGLAPPVVAIPLFSGRF